MAAGPSQAGAGAGAARPMAVEVSKQWRAFKAGDAKSAKREVERLISAEEQRHSKEKKAKGKAVMDSLPALCRARMYYVDAFHSTGKKNLGVQHTTFKVMNSKLEYFLTTGLDDGEGLAARLRGGPAALAELQRPVSLTAVMLSATSAMDMIQAARASPAANIEEIHRVFHQAEVVLKVGSDEWEQKQGNLAEHPGGLPLAQLYRDPVDEVIDPEEAQKPEWQVVHAATFEARVLHFKKLIRRLHKELMKLYKEFTQDKGESEEEEEGGVEGMLKRAGAGGEDSIAAMRARQFQKKLRLGRAEEGKGDDLSLIKTLHEALPPGFTVLQGGKEVKEVEAEASASAAAQGKGKGGKRQPKAKPAAAQPERRKVSEEQVERVKALATAKLAAAGPPGSAQRQAALQRLTAAPLALMRSLVEEALRNEKEGQTALARQQAGADSEELKWRTGMAQQRFNLDMQDIQRQLGQLRDKGTTLTCICQYAVTTAELMHGKKALKDFDDKASSPAKLLRNIMAAVQERSHPKLGPLREVVWEDAVRTLLTRTDALPLPAAMEALPPLHEALRGAFGDCLDEGVADQVVEELRLLLDDDGEYEGDEGEYEVLAARRASGAGTSSSGSDSDSDGGLGRHSMRARRQGQRREQLRRFRAQQMLWTGLWKDYQRMSERIMAQHPGQKIAAQFTIMEMLVENLDNNQVVLAVSTSCSELMRLTELPDQERKRLGAPLEFHRDMSLETQQELCKHRFFVTEDEQLATVQENNSEGELPPCLKKMQELHNLLLGYIVLLLHRKVLPLQDRSKCADPLLLLCDWRAEEVLQHSRASGQAVSKLDDGLVEQFMRMLTLPEHAGLVQRLQGELPAEAQAADLSSANSAARAAASGASGVRLRPQRWPAPAAAPAGGGSSSDKEEAGAGAAQASLVESHTQAMRQDVQDLLTLCLQGHPGPQGEGGTCHLLQAPLRACIQRQLQLWRSCNGVAGPDIDWDVAGEAGEANRRAAVAALTLEQLLQLRAYLLEHVGGCMLAAEPVWAYIQQHWENAMHTQVATYQFGLPPDLPPDMVCLSSQAYSSTCRSLDELRFLELAWHRKEEKLLAAYKQHAAAVAGGDAGRPSSDSWALGLQLDSPEEEQEEGRELLSSLTTVAAAQNQLLELKGKLESDPAYFDMTSTNEYAAAKARHYMNPAAWRQRTLPGTPAGEEAMLSELLSPIAPTEIREPEASPFSLNDAIAAVSTSSVAAALRYSLAHAVREALAAFQAGQPALAALVEKMANYALRTSAVRLNALYPLYKYAQVVWRGVTKRGEQLPLGQQEYDAIQRWLHAVDRLKREVLGVKCMLLELVCDDLQKTRQEVSDAAAAAKARVKAVVEEKEEMAEEMRARVRAARASGDAAAEQEVRGMLGALVERLQCAQAEVENCEREEEMLEREIRQRRGEQEALRRKMIECNERLRSVVRFAALPDTHGYSSQYREAYVQQLRQERQTHAAEVAKLGIKFKLGVDENDMVRFMEVDNLAECLPRYVMAMLDSQEALSLGVQQLHSLSSLVELKVLQGLQMYGSCSHYAAVGGATLLYAGPLVSAPAKELWQRRLLELLTVAETEALLLEEASDRARQAEAAAKEAKAREEKAAKKKKKKDGKGGAAGGGKGGAAAGGSAAGGGEEEQEQEGEAEQDAAAEEEAVVAAPAAAPAAPSPRVTTVVRTTTTLQSPTTSGDQRPTVARVVYGLDDYNLIVQPDALEEAEDPEEDPHSIAAQRRAAIAEGWQDEEEPGGWGAGDAAAAAVAAAGLLSGQPPQGEDDSDDWEETTAEGATKKKRRPKGGRKERARKERVAAREQEARAAAAAQSGAAAPVAAPVAPVAGAAKTNPAKATEPCNLCGQLGHWKAECPYRGSGGAGAPAPPQGREDRSGSGAGRDRGSAAAAGGANAGRAGAAAQPAQQQSVVKGKTADGKPYILVGAKQGQNAQQQQQVQGKQASTAGAASGAAGATSRKDSQDKGWPALGGANQAQQQQQRQPASPLPSPAGGPQQQQQSPLPPFLQSPPPYQPAGFPPAGSPPFPTQPGDAAVWPPHLQPTSFDPNRPLPPHAHMQLQPHMAHNGHPGPEGHMRQYGEHVQPQQLPPEHQGYLPPPGHPAYAHFAFQGPPPGRGAAAAGPEAEEDDTLNETLRLLISAPAAAFPAHQGSPPAGQAPAMQHPQQAAWEEEEEREKQWADEDFSRPPIYRALMTPVFPPPGEVYTPNLPDLELLPNFDRLHAPARGLVDAYAASTSKGRGHLPAPAAPVPAAPTTIAPRSYAAAAGKRAGGSSAPPPVTAPEEPAAVADDGSRPLALPAPDGSLGGQDVDDDEEQLQKAIQASLAEASSRPARRASSVPAAAAAPSYASAIAGPRASSQHEEPGAAPASAGLANATGEYNCFLNTIIQCLWHCQDFRRPMQQSPPGSLSAHPLVAALVDLFHALSAAEEGWQPGTPRRVVNPTALREALHALPGQNFHIGEMNDAQEVLSAIYDCMARVPELRGAKGVPLVEEVFGLVLSEEVRCPCGVTSHVVPRHTEYFHIVVAAALRGIAATCIDGESFGQMLRLVVAQDTKRCDKDRGGCERPLTPVKTLASCPQVFTLQVAWEAEPDSDDIGQTMAALQEAVNTQDVYGNNGPGRSYMLSSMVCYYGQHYFAFILKPELGQWLLFDDAMVQPCGDWASVVRRCQAGKIQPSVLFYNRMTPTPAQALSADSAYSTFNEAWSR